LNKDNAITIPINVTSPILEAIKQCLDSYMYNKNVDHTLIKYPERPEGIAAYLASY
jgi:hypothetical protein